MGPSNLATPLASPPCVRSPIPCPLPDFQPYPGDPSLQHGQGTAILDAPSPWRWGPPHLQGFPPLSPPSPGTPFLLKGTDCNPGAGAGLPLASGSPKARHRPSHRPRMGQGLGATSASATPTPLKFPALHMQRLAWDPVNTRCAELRPFLVKARGRPPPLSPKPPLLLLDKPSCVLCFYFYFFISKGSFLRKTVDSGSGRTVLPMHAHPGPSAP